MIFPNYGSEDILEGYGFSFDCTSLALSFIGNDADLSDEKTVHRQARMLHEYDHLIRSLGSSYGLMRYGLLTLFASKFLEVYNHVGDIDEMRLLWHDVRSRTKPKESLPELEKLLWSGNLESSIYTANCYLEAIRSLDGVNLHDHSIVWLVGWAHYIAALTGQPAQSIEDSDYFLRQLWGTSPGRGGLIYLKGRPLRSMDILEYLGIFREVMHLANHQECGVDFPEDLDGETYLQTLVAVRDIVPEAFSEGEGGMAREIEFAIELALWIPVWPGMKATDLPVHSIHLQPTYRLWYILDAWHRLKLPVTKGTSDHAEDLAILGREWQAAVCRDLGWVEPEFISRKWVEALSHIEGSAQFCPWYWHHPRSKRLAWSKELVLELGLNPIAGAFMAGSKYFQRINFPLYVDKREGSGTITSNPNTEWPDEDEDYQWMDYFLFACSRACLNENEWLSRPEWIRNHAQVVWKSVYR